MQTVRTPQMVEGSGRRPLTAAFYTAHDDSHLALLCRALHGACHPAHEVGEMFLYSRANDIADVGTHQRPVADLRLHREALPEVSSSDR